MVIDGPLWFLGAILVCGMHARFLLSWRREQRESRAWWQKYDADAKQRHDEFLQALARIDRNNSGGLEWKLDSSRERTSMTEFDPATQKIIEDFDGLAKKRAAELLAHTENEPLQATREISFCLGYKAGVVDLGAAQREGAVVDVARLAAVFAAASAWRDSPTVDRRSLAGVSDVHEARLIDAVDAARAARKEGSS